MSQTLQLNDRDCQNELKKKKGRLNNMLVKYKNTDRMKVNA